MSTSLRFSKSLNYKVLAMLFAALTGFNSIAMPIDGLQKVGQAKLAVLFWDIYDSALYTANGRYHAEIYPQALEIIYLRDVEASDLIEKTQEEWKKLGIKDENAANWLIAIAEIFPNIKEGDNLTLVVNSAKQSEFFLNSVPIGIVKDPAFGPNFLRIWLDERSSHPKVRNKLIGKNK